MKFMKYFSVFFAAAMLAAAIGTGCGEGTTDPRPNTESPPLPPEYLSAVAISRTQIRLTWKDRSANESGFDVYESVSSDTAFELLDQTVADVETYIASNKQLDSIDYYYKVRSYNAYGASSFSNEVAMTGGGLVMILDDSPSPVISVAYNPSSEQIIAGCSDYKIRIWDTFDGDLIRVLQLHTSKVNSVSYSVDGKYFASGGNDEVIKIWSFYDDVLDTTLEEDTEGHFIKMVSFSPDSSCLAATAENVHIWSVGDWALVKSIKEVRSRCHAFSPDGEYIAIGSALRISIWESTLMDTIMVSSTGIGGSDYLAFSNDSRHLAVAVAKGIKIYNFNDGDITGQVISIDGRASEDEPGDGHTGKIYCLDYNPDGYYLASGSDDNTIKVWNANTYELLATLDAHGVAVYTLEFSPDSLYLASGGGDKKVKIWATFF